MTAVRTVRVGAAAVAGGSPEATAAGIDVLGSGGNAVDAVIAAALVQSVVEIPAGGIGGDAFLLLRTADGQVVAINGSGASPTTLAGHVAEGDVVPRFGPLSVAVPGFVGAVEIAHGVGGSIPLAELYRPAIAAAADGFEVSTDLLDAIGRVRSELEPDSTLLGLFERNPSSVGGSFRRPQLAATLARIAEGGADAFYRDLGRGIAVRLAQRGGALSPEDLAGYDVLAVAPVAADYGNLRVLTNPPVSLGCVLLQELALFERLGLRYRDPMDPRRIDAMVRCKLAAFADAAGVLRDPALGDSGVRRLLDGPRIDRRARGLATAPLAQIGTTTVGVEGVDTTCVVAADAAGNAAALIHSLFNEFGSRELDEPTGVLLNDRLANQRVSMTGRAGVAPGAKPLHTLGAVLAMRDGVPALLAATPGGRGQVQTLFQVLVNVFDGGLDAQAAIDAPRWLSGAPRRPEPNDHLYLEPGVGGDVVAALAEAGHDVTVTDDVEADLYGSCVAVGRHETGAVFAAADGRRQAVAAAI